MLGSEGCTEERAKAKFFSKYSEILSSLDLFTFSVFLFQCKFQDLFSRMDGNKDGQVTRRPHLILNFVWGKKNSQTDLRCLLGSSWKLAQRTTSWKISSRLKTSKPKSCKHYFGTMPFLCEALIEHIKLRRWQLDKKLSQHSLFLSKTPLQATQVFLASQNSPAVTRRRT